MHIVNADTEFIHVGLPHRPDVFGPRAAVTDNAVARWHGTDGRHIQDSLVTIDDAGNITLPALATIDGRDPSADGVIIDAALVDGDFAANGIMVRTALGAYTNRTIVAGSAKITVASGDGVAGNPSIDFGTVEIDDLHDVNTTGVGDGDVLVYSAGSKQWLDAGVGAGLEVTGGNLQVDEDAIPFTPGAAGDWDAGDPGDVDDALDELAQRVKVFENSAASVALGGTPSLSCTPRWFKIGEIDESDYTGAGNSEDEICFVLPAAGVIHFLKALITERANTPFGIWTATLEFGTAADSTKYSDGGTLDWDQAANTFEVFGPADNPSESHTASTNIIAKLRVTGILGGCAGLNAGKCQVYVLLSAAI